MRDTTPNYSRAERERAVRILKAMGAPVPDIPEPPQSPAGDAYTVALAKPGVKVPVVATNSGRRLAAQPMAFPWTKTSGLAKNANILRDVRTGKPVRRGITSR